MHSRNRGSHRAKFDYDDFNSFRVIACDGHTHTHACTKNMSFYLNALDEESTPNKYYVLKTLVVAASQSSDVMLVITAWDFNSGWQFIVSFTVLRGSHSTQRHNQMSTALELFRQPPVNLLGGPIPKNKKKSQYRRRHIFTVALIAWGCLLGGVYVPCIYRMSGGVIVGDSLLLCACSMCDVDCSSAVSSPLFVVFFLKK